MVLLSFSDPKHVPLIISGEKAQTTRKPRKNPIKVGDTLHVYFKLRMAKTCENCIFEKCICSVQNRKGVFLGEDCAQQTNFFGTAKVIRVAKLRETTSLIENWRDDIKEWWANLDGFSSFAEANEWFTRVHGPDWQAQDWDVIYFEGDWLK